MKQVYEGANGEWALTVENVNDTVQLRARGSGSHSVTAMFSPNGARGLAETIERAADEAESGTSEEARLRLELAAVDDALRAAGIEYPLGARGVRDLAGLLELAREDSE
ncbi:hypothetical protein [Streptomyces sp. NPDC091212]|uniref:hypothetical protein n=1 Tax=Streptomyces sp. NPDC091212 TaxID=3155191 RepID=UPI00344A1833